MSLVRAFTTRKARKAPEISAPMPQRSNTSKYAFPTGTIRHKISAPVELLSTTNMLSYNAPDLFPTDVSSPPSLIHSSGSSARSISSEELSVATPLTSPESEADGEMPKPNHLSCYFEKRASSSSTEDPAAPVIPQRSPSHTKRTHEIVHRKRSIHRMSGQYKHQVKTSITGIARDSLQMFSTPELVEEIAEDQYQGPSSYESSPTPSQHPFGAELAQLTELAEEVSLGGVQVLDEEEMWLISQGLQRFAAQDYMAEIQCFYDDSFGPASKRPSIWI